MISDCDVRQTDALFVDRELTDVGQLEIGVCRGDCDSDESRAESDDAFHDDPRLNWMAIESVVRTQRKLWQEQNANFSPRVFAIARSDFRAVISCPKFGTKNPEGETNRSDR